MKKIITLLLCTSCLFSFAQTTYVPDDNFEQKLILLGYDSGPLDDYVLTKNIESVVYLDISFLAISDLTGIEGFKSLEVLNAENNTIITADFSQNINLEELNIGSNKLTTINVSQNINLADFRCFNNSLSSIDVSKNTELIKLNYRNNKVSTIDLSNNLKLSGLDCSNNSIEKLNIEKNINLHYLDISLNKFKEIDLSKNIDLLGLNCSNNLLTQLNLDENIYLYFIDCSRNLFTTVNLSRNDHLKTFIATHGKLESLDFSKNHYLEKIIINNNKLSFLDVRNKDNSIIRSFNFNTRINSLQCIYVNDKDYSTSNWLNIDSNTSFANDESECDALSCNISVDVLNDVDAYKFYILPNLTNGLYYTESDGNGNQLYSGDTINFSQTVYVYNVDSINPNCTAQSSFSIIIRHLNDLDIPAYFTPNNDGKNDTWIVKGTGILEVTIYDRFGKIINKIKPNSDGWDGIYNGEQLPSNSYWYQVLLTNGEIKNGHFALIRK